MLLEKELETMVSKTAVQALIEENEAHKKTIASLRAESDAKNRLYLQTLEEVQDIVREPGEVR